MVFPANHPHPVFPIFAIAATVVVVGGMLMRGRQVLGTR